jgi:hypothetical protein
MRIYLSFVLGFKNWTFLLLLLCVSLQSKAQTIRFSADANATQVPLGGYVEVSFILENATLQNPQLPIFKEFNIVSGPNRGNSITIINGKKKVEERISYTLQTKSLGQVTIPPAKITIAGKIYATNSIYIEVVRGTPNAKEDNKAAFLILESDVKETYVGGQIIVSLQLLSKNNVSPMSLLKAPDFSNFVAKEIPFTERGNDLVLHKGIQYPAKILKKIILYPQKNGSFTIDPYAISATIGNIFDANAVGLESNSLILNVKNVPENAPDYYNGSIGVMELSSEINKNQSNTDEALSLQVSVSGKGDPNRIFAPKFRLSDSLECFEPKLISENISEEDGSFSKVFEYLIVGKYAGKYAIEPGMVYFDTESQQFETIKTGTHWVEISQGIGQKNNNTDTEDITPQTNKTNLPWTTIIAALVGLGLVVLLLYWWKKRKSNIATPPTIDFSDQTKETNTTKTVSEPLLFYNFDSADEALKRSDLNQFYKSISANLTTQIMLTCAIAEENPSRTVLLHQLSHSPKAYLVPNVNELLEQCDKIRFGMTQSDVNPTDILAKAKNLCTQLKT